MKAQSFRDLIIQNMDSIEKCITKRALYEQEIQKSGFVSDKGNANSLENDCSMTRNESSSQGMNAVKEAILRIIRILCNNAIKSDQNADDYEDERVVLANLIANLKLDTSENKKIQKQLKKANATLTHELNGCKSVLEESNDIRDRCISALDDQDIELEKYKKYKNYQLKKEEVEQKYKENLGLLA
nr:hypothetical protein [Tanacetum cinerariifolium]